MEETFIIITWPDTQILMEKKGFRTHSCLINSEPFLGTYGSSAYFVEQSWLDLI